MHTVPASIPPPLVLTAAAALLVLPLVLLAHWTAIAERGGERAWFGFVVRFQLFVVGSMYLDVPAVLGLGLERVTAAAGGPATWPAGLPTWVLAVSITLVHLGAAAFAARRVRRILRGATGAATSVSGTLHSLLARLSPILGLLGALAAIRQQEWRIAG